MTNDVLLIPKSVLVKHGVWPEVVHDMFLSGFTDDQIRADFREYGCCEAEIEDYFEWYEELELELEADMTAQQAFDYPMYRVGCWLNDIEPKLADFLAGEIPWPVISHMGFEQNEVEWEKSKAFAATA